MVKEKKIITRLEDNLYDEIERFSLEKGWSKSKVSRLALQEYLFTFGSSVHYIICSGHEYKFLLECLNENQIKELAHRAYKKIYTFRSYFMKEFLKLEGEDLNKYPLKPQMNVLMRNMFKISFDKIDTIWKKRWILIFGDHQLGLNFSKFFKFLMIEFLEPFDFVIIKETLEDSKIVFEFSKQPKK